MNCYKITIAPHKPNTLVDESVLERERRIANDGCVYVVAENLAGVEAVLSDRRILSTEIIGVGYAEKEQK